MRYCFYTNIVSPHQMPFARALVQRVGVANYRYVHSETFHAERSAIGWSAESEPWILSQQDRPEESHDWLENADVLILGHRDLDLIERRCKRGLLTFYASERWFKPVVIPLFATTFRLNFTLPGWIRLLVPSYWMMARRFVVLFCKHDNFRLFPYGVWAERDFRLLCRLCHPLVTNSQQLTAKITTWGYAVAPSTQLQCEGRSERCGEVLRVLWVGRMLELKHVDTIIKAVALANSRGNNRQVTLTLVGDGPEKSNLQRLASKLEKKEKKSIVDQDLRPRPTAYTFLAPVPIGQVRALMRQHDLYVFASDGRDGWGAVVSEALEECMLCAGSREAGAPATLLPETCQFAPTDPIGLAELLDAAAEGRLPRAEIGRWSAVGLVDLFLKIVSEAGTPC